MSVRTTRTARWLAAAALLLTATGVAPAGAGEVRLASAGAVQAVVRDLVAAYEKETGNKVAATFGPVGVVRKTLAAEPTDVVVLSDTAIEAAMKDGSVVAGSRSDIARTAMGIGVRDGAPRPDISTPEALKQTLLAAKSITYVDPAQGATSGIHFASVLQRLGIAEQVKAKTRLVPGGYPAELVAKGEVELVAHQISEIMPVKGVTLVGPLPRELQKLTIYSAGVAARSAAPELARGFVAFLMRPQFRPKFAAAGLDYKE
jgi:molybdate transport system substrate-binding protein